MPNTSILRVVALSSLGLAVLLQGCGGSEAVATDAVAAINPHSSTVAAAGTVPDRVTLEGCVVDQYYVPSEGVPISVRTADGRALAQARSGRMGEFTVQVPAGTTASVAVDRTEGDRLPLPLIDRDQVVETCLVARNEPAVGGDASADSPYPDRAKELIDNAIGPVGR